MTVVELLTVLGTVPLDNAASRQLLDWMAAYLQPPGEPPSQPPGAATGAIFAVHWWEDGTDIIAAGPCSWWRMPSADLLPVLTQFMSGAI